MIRDGKKTISTRTRSAWVQTAILYPIPHTPYPIVHTPYPYPMPHTIPHACTAASHQSRSTPSFCSGPFGSWCLGMSAAVHHMTSPEISRTDSSRTFQHSMEHSIKHSIKHVHARHLCKVQHACTHHWSHLNGTPLRALYAARRCSRGVAGD